MKKSDHLWLKIASKWAADDSTPKPEPNQTQTGSKPVPNQTQTTAKSSNSLKELRGLLEIYYGLDNVR
jgi:hypothetical protein